MLECDPGGKILPLGNPKKKDWGCDLWKGWFWKEWPTVAIFHRIVFSNRHI
jgi:hypothetical protein